MARSALFPFFDELVAAQVPGLGKVAWTPGFYLRYAVALRERAQQLGTDWTPTMVERALNQSIFVQKDQSLSVGRNRTKSVAKDESADIGANRTESIGKDESITIGANRTESVTKDENVDVGGKREVSSGKDDLLSVGKKFGITAGDGIILKTGSVRASVAAGA